MQVWENLKKSLENIHLPAHAPKLIVLFLQLNRTAHNVFYLINTCIFFFNMKGFAPEVKAENEEELPDSDPHWGIDVVFLKNTTLCYGPWVDRQR